MILLLMLGLALVAVSGVLVLRSLSLTRVERRRTLDQIAVYGFGARQQAATQSPDLRETVGEIATATGTRALARFGGLRKRERAVRALLSSAGMYGTSVATFYGYRILAASVPPLALLLLTVLGNNISLRGILGIGLLAVMGWFFPYLLAQRRARLRVGQIDREVPELVDLLVTTVEGGVGFAAGLQLASRSIEGPLGQELRLALREQSLGLTPEEALRNLAARVESPAMRAFVQALVQGETLGVSIGMILRDLAIDMRKRRRQSAEERAQKSPTKILFPLVALILPATFIVTLGPVGMSLLDFFANA